MKAESPIHRLTLVGAALVVVLCCSPAIAGSLRLDEGSTVSRLLWTVSGEPVDAHLVVSGAAGPVVSRAFGPGEPIAWDLRDDAGYPVPDGVYRYELRVAPSETLEALRLAALGGDGAALEAARTEMRSRRRILAGELALVAGLVTVESLSRAAEEPDAPVAPAHLEVNATGPVIRLSSGSGGSQAAWDMRMATNDFQLVDQTGFPDSKPFQIEAGAGDDALYIDQNGNVGIGTSSPAGTLDVNGTIYLSGAQIHPTPDFVFDPEYELETIREHAALMWRNKHLPAVGPGRVDGSGYPVVELGARSQGMLEELEKAHIYIEQLHLEVERLKSQLAAIEKRLD